MLQVGPSNANQRLHLSMHPSIQQGNSGLMDGTFTASQKWLPCPGWVKELPNFGGWIGAACVRQRQWLDTLCL